VSTVAAIEELLLAESQSLLSACRYLNGVEDVDLSEEQLHDVLQSYLLLFRAGLPRNFDEARHKHMKARAKTSKDWAAVQKFESEAVEEFKQKAERVPDRISWKDASAIVLSLAKGYGRWQNGECLMMKSSLNGLADPDTGHVPLTRFYGEPSHANFQFTESKEYLRKAGILLEATGDKEAEVLIANYLLGPSNCIASSEYFAVCCLNDCEDIMGSLESRSRGLAVSVADAVEEVNSIRDELSANDGAAISENLENELKSLAGKDGTTVSLHSPGFRAWLHKVFPDVCPLPTAADRAFEEAELSEAKEWLQKDLADRNLWEPMLLHSAEDGTRRTEWMDEL